MNLKLENTNLRSFKVLSFLMMSLMSFNMMAGNTVHLTISGIVDEVITLSISPKGDYSNLDLHSTQIDVPVATIYESSNSSKGYIIKARSENSSQIKNVSGEDAVPYYLRYGGGPQMALTNQDQAIKEQSIGGLYSSVGKDVTISFKGIPATHLNSGIYRDVITFTIESR